jgi:hypothetical protein
MLDVMVFLTSRLWTLSSLELLRKNSLRTCLRRKAPSRNDRLDLGGDSIWHKHPVCTSPRTARSQRLYLYVISILTVNRSNSVPSATYNMNSSIVKVGSGSWALVLPSWFQDRLVSLAASTQALITFCSPLAQPAHQSNLSIHVFWGQLNDLRWD